MTVEANSVPESRLSRNRPATFILFLFAVFVFVAPQSVAESAEERRDRFKLYSDCNEMALVVEGLPTDATEIGLSEDAIQAAVESRLRSARIYRAADIGIPFLYINVNVVGRAFSIRLAYKKILYDEDYAHTSQFATTWNLGALGTHSGDAAYILSSLSQIVDRFLVEYLRVNEDACE